MLKEWFYVVLAGQFVPCHCFILIVLLLHDFWKQTLTFFVFKNWYNIPLLAMAGVFVSLCSLSALITVSLSQLYLVTGIKTNKGLVAHGP